MNPAKKLNSSCCGRDPHDLDWLAFQYIAGECSAAEREAFEDRLATDQVAREAVARAVQLAETTALAIESAPMLASSTRPWSRVVAWAACGIAAAVAVAVTLSGWWQPPAANSEPVIQIASGPGEVRELAMAWATGRTDSFALLTDVPDSTEEALASLGTSGEEVEDIETPAWMLIAVAGLSQGSQDLKNSPDSAPTPDGQGLE